ncbi:MAG: phage baseplate assembly protein [Deltaproteobacteria bacterium]|nr:phage baseplate assembly protein [Deltaproteobacteria bacterium]
MKLIRSIITAVTEGKIKLFSGAGRVGESFSDREYFQHYGFTSRPLEGAEAILIKDGNVIQVIASDDRRYRLAVEDGEVAIYSDEGDKVHLKRENKIEIKSGGTVIIDAPNINLGVGSETDPLHRLIDERFKDLFNNHIHSGVQVGVGVTGKPTPVDPLILDNHATSIVKGK